MKPIGPLRMLPLCALAAVCGAQVSRAQETVTPRPKILGVSHIAIFAADYEKSRAYYHDFLGFEEAYSLTKPDGTPAMTFFKINERQYIELFPQTASGT